MTAFDSLKRHLHSMLTAVLLGSLALVGCLVVASAPASAESLITRDTPGYQQLTQEISSLQSKGQSLSASQSQRLDDLQRLEVAIANSNDRATVSNGSTHNLGLFARYKKEPADQQASFYVLAPGHESDDDYEVVALYVPAEVALAWDGAAAPAAAPSPRLVRVLPGEQLAVTDPATDALAYQLNLPAFAVDSQNPEVAALPSFNQEQLDSELETAPVD